MGVVDVRPNRDGLTADKFATTRADLQQVCEVAFHLAEVQGGHGGHTGIGIVYQRSGLGWGDEMRLQQGEQGSPAHTGAFIAE